MSKINTVPILKVLEDRQETGLHKYSRIGFLLKWDERQTCSTGVMKSEGGGGRRALPCRDSLRYLRPMSFRPERHLGFQFFVLKLKKKKKCAEITQASPLVVPRSILLVDPPPTSLLSSQFAVPVILLEHRT